MTNELTNELTTRRGEASVSVARTIARPQMLKLIAIPISYEYVKKALYNLQAREESVDGSSAFQEHEDAKGTRLISCFDALLGGWLTTCPLGRT